MPLPGDPRVDAYIAGLPALQRELCADLRRLIRGVDPEIVETIKRTKLSLPL